MNPYAKYIAFLKHPHKFYTTKHLKTEITPNTSCQKKQIRQHNETKTEMHTHTKKTTSETKKKQHPHKKTINISNNTNKASSTSNNAKKASDWIQNKAKHFTSPKRIIFIVRNKIEQTFFIKVLNTIKSHFPNIKTQIISPKALSTDDISLFITTHKISAKHTLFFDNFETLQNNKQLKYKLWKDIETYVKQTSDR